MSLRWYAALAVVLCGCAAQTDAADAAAGQTAGVSRALLIGINRYKSVPGLQGSVNDVETMREILTTRWGFSPNNITMLTDEQATRANMMAAFNELVSTAGPDDTVYVHYSGHGSQVQDLNGDETDGLDETIVSQDGRSGDVPDIVDDELDAIFSKLRSRSAVIVLDSCHSGTATRAFDIRARSLPQDTRVDLYRSGLTGTTTRGISSFKRSRFVVMSGAADNEEALDGPVEGRYHGFFTYALSRSFVSASVNASPREIFNGVVGELGRIQTTFGRTSMPEPQIEAPPDALDRPLFARSIAATDASPGAQAQAPRLASLIVEPSTNDTITLVNGVLLGAAPGSTWAIYPPGETKFTPGHALAVATATAITGKDVKAGLDQHVVIAPKSRAVALMAAPSSARVTIRVLDVPTHLRRQIEDVLTRNVKDVELVASDEPARFLVDVKGQQVRLLTADGLRVVGTFTVGDENSVANVARIASRSTKASELLALDNPSSRLVVTVRVAGNQPTAARDIKLVADTAPARLHSRHEGEPRTAQNSLQLSITVSADAYLTIVDVDPEGNVNVLFPNTYQQRGFSPDGAVRAGEEVLIPDSLLPGNRAGFYWDYSPPAGTDTVRVFATTDVATARMIRSRISSLQQAPAQSGATPQTRSIAEGMGTLRTDLTQLATRGIKTVADDSAQKPTSAASDWAAASVTVQVDD